jgi:hypothetical protein
MDVPYFPPVKLRHTETKNLQFGQSLTLLLERRI